MFTGIVQAIGRVARAEARGGDRRLTVSARGLEAMDVAEGDSIAVSGCCLTVATRASGAFAFDVSNETLALTTLGTLHAGDRVNLERALRLSDGLGGHLVSGHVDDVGTLAAVAADARSRRWTIAMPGALSRYVAVKGSIAVDGVSLTVNGVGHDRFDVNLVPHTLAATTFGERKVGDRVNLEVDLLARYLERLLDGRSGAAVRPTGGHARSTGEQA